MRCANKKSHAKEDKPRNTVRHIKMLMKSIIVSNTFREHIQNETQHHRMSSSVHGKYSWQLLLLLSFLSTRNRFAANMEWHLFIHWQASDGNGTGLTQLIVVFIAIFAFDIWVVSVVASVTTVEYWFINFHLITHAQHSQHLIQSAPHSSTEWRPTECTATQRQRWVCNRKFFGIKLIPLPLTD